MSLNSSGPVGRPDCQSGHPGFYRAALQRLAIAALILLIIGGASLFLPVVPVAAASTAAASTGQPLLATTDDLKDKRLGVFEATVFDNFVRENYPQSTRLSFTSGADMIMALKTGKIDAAFFDKVSALVILQKNPDLGILTDNLLDMPLGMGFNKNNPQLLADFNAFLREIRANGIMDDACQRWFDHDPEKAVMPDIDRAAKGQKLYVGVSVADLPYIAYANGQYVGFDIEIISRFAASINRPVEFVSMEFSSLIISLAAGKVDMISDGITITEERARQINFSDPYVNARTAVIALKKNLPGYTGPTNPEEPDRTFFQKLGDSFYNNIILENRYRLILSGFRVTVIIALLSAVLGTLLGALVCFLHMARNRILHTVASIYITILRGLPALVLLLIIFYVVFASVQISALLVAVVAFSLNFAAYVSEMFRAAILSIDKGQTEAGIAGGFSRGQTFLYIVMPQAIRQVLPVYKGELISMVKMTSIVGYIAVEDLTKAGDIIRSRTFDAFFPLLMVALLYFLISGLLIAALSTLERRSRHA